MREPGLVTHSHLLVVVSEGGKNLISYNVNRMFLVFAPVEAVNQSQRLMKTKLVVVDFLHMIFWIKSKVWL